ncbi:exopolysaccharide transport family protein [Pannonibacter tanglangensis]|uniref:exopolysaccharide transport family protein n=1 Tax=Pannonibacter tanglangensis TaxID=2750084 RepID=UPI0015D3DEB9|nr:exopolysaccharide transport family protein [Pannonibacter sp. XCT-53]
MSSRHDIYQPQDMALDLTALIRALGRAQRWLLPLVIAVALSVVIGLQFVPQKFTGEAKILIESSNPLYPGAGRGAEDERALLDNEGVTSQVQLMSSVDLARRVAQRLDLASIPEFKANGTGGTLQNALVLLGILTDPARISPEERVLKHYFKNLDVYRLDGSRVIAVEYQATSPELAAQVANTIVDEYLQMQSMAKRESREVAASALEPQIDRLRQDVQVARKAVEDFRARADLLVGNDNLTLNQQQMSEISTEQSGAEAAAAEAEAKARQLRQLLSSGGSLESASEVLNSGLIQRLRERQVELQSRIAELSTTLLPGHPQLRALSSQLADYDQQIRGEARKVLAGLETDAAVARQQAEALRNRLDELKAAAAQSNSDQVRLRELEREADAKAAQLDALLASYRTADTGRNAEALPADARVISRAGVPIEPSSPKVMFFTIAASLATFVLGCAFVIMREFLRGDVLRPLEPMDTYEAPVEIARPQPVTGDRSAAAPPARADDEPGLAIAGSDDGIDDDGIGLDRDEDGGLDGEGDLPEPEDLPRRRETAAGEAAALAAARLADRDDSVDAVPAEPLGRRAAPDRTGERTAERFAEPVTARSEAEARPERARPAAADPVTRREAGSAARRVERLTESVAMPDALRAAAATATAAAAAKAASGPAARAVSGLRRTVVVSAAEPQLSHQLAFQMARQAADDGDMSLLMEVFPDSDDPAAAAGFSDLIASNASFSSVIYRDAGSRAHIIEAGRLPLPDRQVDPRRFALVLDAIDATYDRIVIDLGRCKDSAAAAEILAFADQVIVASRTGIHAARLAEVLDLVAALTEADVTVRRVAASSKAA